MHRPRVARRGFTLVELLVVISIIGVLMSLLLPAVQSAREAGRRTTCLNNLKQMGLSAQSHLEKLKRYPTGGWGPRWVGDPDRGSGDKQPGGWVYALLPYMEQENLHQLGVGETNVAKKRDAVKRLASIPQQFMHCPTRRGIQTYPYGIVPNRELWDPTSTAAGGTELPYSFIGSQIARGDYAANAGVRKDNGVPVPLGCRIDESDYPHVYKEKLSVNTNPSPNFNLNMSFSGVIYTKSTTSDANVRDGTTHTYLFGEKFVDRSKYDTGDYISDDDSVYGGMGNDNYRTTYVQNPNEPAESQYPPWTLTMLNDQLDPDNSRQCLFGSPHAGIVHYAMCDGSTKSISATLDPLTHRYLGERNDRQILDDSVIGQ